MFADVVVGVMRIDKSGAVGKTLLVLLGSNTSPPASLDFTDSPRAFTAVTW